MPVRYWNRLLGLINKTLLHHLDVAMAPDYDVKFKYPPVFFLGAPRSGSTLIYQVMTEVFDVAYLSNRHCQFFGAPALAERLFHPLSKKSASDFTSNHGETSGWSAPSECGQWWYRFFRRIPAYVTLADVEENKIRSFRRSLLAFTRATDKPVIFKNLYASLRLQAIAKHVPEALFIIVHRDELDNGHSLLETRRKVYGSYEKWWSMPPPDIDNIQKTPVYEQVIEQIRSIHQTILADLNISNVPKKKIYHINYEQFCDDVHGEATKLNIFLRNNSCARKFKLISTPHTFERREAIRIDEGLYESMREYINEKK